jgi:hypothetical protein
VDVVGQETIPVMGREIKAWKTTEKLGQTVSTAWYGEQGESLKREMSNGLTMTMANAKAVVAKEPEMRYDLPMAKEPDKAWIRSHLDPSLEGKPLESLLSMMPGG